MHPSAALKGTKSNKLAGKRIVLGITGSIGAVSTIKLAHELIRHGAEVIPVMTEAATRIIHPDSIWAASGRKPILELTGDAEHVSICGEADDRADLLLIAPATANTITKIALCIADNALTTFATTAIGTGIPVLIVPAMHRTMYENPILQENIEKLEKLAGPCEFVGPFIEEGKVKIADNEDIVSRVIRRLWKNDLAGMRVLVVAGSTAEPLDDFRVLTNRSTGKMGIELAKCAFERGAEVSLWYGASPNKPPEYLHSVRFQTVNDLFGVMSFLDNHITIVCAAIADYTPQKQPGKISSGQKELSLHLTPTPKVLAAIREADPGTYLVGFKAEYDMREPELVEKAFTRLESMRLNMIVANDLKQVTEEKNHIYIIKSNRERTEVEGDKSNISIKIFDEIVDDFKSKESISLIKE